AFAPPRLLARGRIVMWCVAKYDATSPSPRASRPHYGRPPAIPAPHPPRGHPVIELQDLRKEFAGTTALDGISLSVAAGEIHGIVGRSGAGKSTLIRCLTGLEPVTAGSALIDDIDITQLRGARLRESRRTIGMVFQHAN